MKFSRYFVPTMVETPADATIISHQLMLRAGMIRQSASGIYTWLPLGLRVLENISQIVKAEMNNSGAIELLMPTIQSAELWEESGRYDAYGPEMLRIKDRHERDMLYGPTNEEMVTDIFRRTIHSYKDLPMNLYHIQWKFRDEIRPRFGVMRGREFLMKDAYSFDLNHEEGEKSYHKMFVAYLRLFNRLGVTAIPMIAETGPIGGNLSHEFLILAETGESELFCDPKILELDNTLTNIDYDGDLSPIINRYTQFYAATDEMHDVNDPKVQALGDKLLTMRGIEVGHIFLFGTKYSEPMKATVMDENGTPIPVYMGSYGVGVSRLVGAIIEACHDDNGIIWPESIAPFTVGIINLKTDDDECNAVSEMLHDYFEANNITVLYDDRKERAGVKFKDMDLIGLPWHITVGPRGLKEGKIELKNRATGEKTEMTIDEVKAKFI
ncbi:MAG: proline--tRNA ligase [Alphaproteobacteria bacterium]